MSETQPGSRPSTPEEPIATYREERFDGKRFFELFADRVRIRGKVQLQSDFDTVIPLSTLHPTPSRIRIRNKGFWHGIWMLLGAIMLDTFLITPLRVPPENFAIMLVGAFGFAGFVTALLAARKIEFIFFNSTAGIPILDFARKGPDAAKLDAFAELVSRHISSATSPGT